MHPKKHDGIPQANKWRRKSFKRQTSYGRMVTPRATARPNCRRPRNRAVTNSPRSRALGPRAERASCSWTQGFTTLEENCEFDECKKRKMIPPHVVVARRAADKAAFSMFAGNGRTLKGRDMKRVRDAVLRMTGFLER
ncbi:uncharacterized protein A4U43_C05F30710 [Asparagus officinalis]|uniref:Uncharacterized protein n=1 Tax=Asparagus officinalis TaxID=4686 RepID=A0A5P1EWC1_ASPOF|nr:uncharacterized protein A4U43_C05F30710 [Asparagus officinalis]